MFEKLRPVQSAEEPQANGDGHAHEVHASGSPVGRLRPSLASLMAEEGIASKEQLEEAVAEGLESGERLGEVVLRRGWTTEAGLANLIARQWDLSFVARSVISVDEHAKTRMPREHAAQVGVCPVTSNDGAPLVAIADPSEDRFAAARETLGDCIFVVTTPSALAQLIDELPSSPDAPQVLSVAEAPEATAEVFAVPEVESEAEVTPMPSPAVSAFSEPVGDNSPVLDQLDRLLDQLVSERASTSDELAGYRRRLDELSEEKSRLEESVRSLEAKLGHEDQQLDSMRTKLSGLTQALDRP